MFLKHTLRTRLSLLWPSLGLYDTQQQQKQIEQYNKFKAKLWELEPHDSVIVRSLVHVNTEWLIETVVKRLGSLIYFVRIR